MEKLVATCDVCGKTKEETNHWYFVFREGATVFTIATWEFGRSVNPLKAQIFHCCGRGCALKKASEVLGEM